MRIGDSSIPDSGSLPTSGFPRVKLVIRETYREVGEADIWDKFNVEHRIIIGIKWVYNDIPDNRK